MCRSGCRRTRWPSGPALLPTTGALWPLGKLQWSYLAVVPLKVTMPSHTPRTSALIAVAIGWFTLYTDPITNDLLSVSILASSTTRHIVSMLALSRS